MSRILTAPLGYGLLATVTLGIAAPAQANPYNLDPYRTLDLYNTSVYCTESVQQETTIQSFGHVQITDVRPNVTRTCYERSPNQSIYFNPYGSRHHRETNGFIVPPQIQIRLGPNFSITTGGRQDNWGYNRDRFNRDRRYDQPFGFSIFNRHHR